MVSTRLYRSIRPIENTVACLLLGLVLLASTLSGFTIAVQAAEPDVLYFHTVDFPYDVFVQTPVPGEEKTRFYQELNQSLEQLTPYHLTERVDEARYQVHLNCGGIFNCSELQLDVYSPERVALTTIRIDGKRYPWSRPPLKKTADAIAQALNERLPLLQQGETGVYDIRGFRH